MKSEVVQAILSRLHSIDDVEELAESVPGVSHDTISSIFNQQYMTLVRLTSAKHKARVGDYYRRYKQGESIVSVAEDVNHPPRMLAQYIVAAFLHSKDIELNGARKRSFGSLDKKARNRYHSLARSVIRSSLPIDPRLDDQVMLAIESDPVYGLSSDKIRYTIGLEHEYILYRKLSNLGVSFLNETQLRRLGHGRTPDAKLETPIAISGRVICWIDSKAMFGDKDSYAQHLRDQFEPYINRYGPGMAIYWFDFDEGIAAHPSILVTKDFPARSQITLPLVKGSALAAPPAPPDDRHSASGTKGHGTGGDGEADGDG